MSIPHTKERVVTLLARLDELGAPRGWDRNRDNQQNIPPDRNLHEMRDRPFSETRDEVCKELFAEVNVRVFNGMIPRDLIVRWCNKLNKTAGTTYLRRNGQMERSAEIRLSTKVLDSREKLMKTLCHEMCHVVAWLVDSVAKPPHGDVFKKWAGRVNRIYPEVKVTTTHSYEINYKFNYECIACRHTFGRHSNSINLETQRCGRCMGMLRRFQLLRL